MCTRNLTLLTDLYELTMMQGYYHSGSQKDKTVVFDAFYRVNPSGNGFAICCGLEQIVEYIKGLNFNEADIEYLKDFRFTGEIYAIPEGTVVFPMEPLLRIKANIMQAQLLEAALLNIVNHQSLIATKASRVVWAAQGDPVMEFGLRRAQGPDAGIYGARAAVIGGCCGTSNVLTGQMFDIAVKGTHAHSWVMSFPTELDAFRAYAKEFPNMCILLVDTYNTLEQGVPDAITVFKEMKAKGPMPKGYGIRLDSGDIAYLSKKARIMLDEAGFTDAIISASSDLDEDLIASLKTQGAKVSLWGVGTKLITSSDSPAFGGVYKLAAETDDEGNFVPKIKLSNNPEKVTIPGIKKILRIYDNATGKIKADLLLFDQNATWKTMTLKGGTYTIRELLVPVFKDGELVYGLPSTQEIVDYAKKELDTLWDEHRRLKNPQIVPVDLSERLYLLREKMIRQMK